MLHDTSRTTLIGGWFATLAVTAVIAVVAGASLATTTLLLVVGLAAAVAIGTLAGAPKPTVAEILHSVETNDGRRG